METRTIGDEIKHLLEQRGLTAYRLSVDSGVARSLLSEVLSSKKVPTDEVLEKLAPHLGVDALELKALSALGRMTPDVRAYVLEHAEKLRGQGELEPPTKKDALSFVQASANKKKADEDKKRQQRQPKADPDAYEDEKAAAGKGIENLDSDRRKHDDLDGEFADD